MIVAIALGALLVLAQDVAPAEAPLVSQLLVTAPVLNSAESANAVADSAANANSDRVACRQEVKPNSRFTRRVCRKAKDWNNTAKGAQANLGSIQSRNNSQDSEREGVYGP